MQAGAASPVGLRGGLSLLWWRRWMLMCWYGQILGGPRLSLIVLSFAPHWPEFSALWANGGSLSRETRPVRLTGHRTICCAESRSRPQIRNKIQCIFIRTQELQNVFWGNLLLPQNIPLTSLTKQTPKKTMELYYVHGIY